MAIAARVRASLESQSWVRRMFELGLEMKKEHGEERVFDLSLGNPVLEPPEEFLQELRRLCEDPAPGMHRYMPNAGYADTRQAVAEHVAGNTGLPFGGGDIVMTCGAGGALNVIFKSILDPGDEVVAFSPYFPEYRFYVENHGGVLKTAPTDDGFQLDVAALEPLLGPRTRAVLVNSPNNPSGAVYPEALLAKLGEALAGGGRRRGTGRPSTWWVTSPTRGSSTTGWCTRTCTDSTTAAWWLRRFRRTCRCRGNALATPPWGRTAPARESWWTPWCSATGCWAS